MGGGAGRQFILTLSFGVYDATRLPDRRVLSKQLPVNHFFRPVAALQDDETDQQESAVSSNLKTALPTLTLMPFESFGFVSK